MQLRFTPPQKRLRQLESAENLLSSINPDQLYPFEFVFFKIIGFETKNLAELESIKGDALAADLRVFISKLSSQVASEIDPHDEKIYATPELAAKLSISVKTIERWKNHGLISRKYIFPDGKKRFGFKQSDLDNFIGKNHPASKRALSFKRLTEPEKRQIIQAAIKYAADPHLSRCRIIAKLAAEFNRAHETVRYILLNFEKNNSDKTIFLRPPGVISTAQTAEIYKLYQQGAPIPELVQQYSRNKSSIYRLINTKRAKALLAKKIEYIPSPEFSMDNTALLLNRPADPNNSLASKEHIAENPLSAYPTIPTDTAKLSREQEYELFRSYNYLKYLATQKCSRLSLSRISGRLLTDIEHHLSQSETIKKRIIEAGLDIVANISRKHTSSGIALQDLISEGNLSLMRAVEKFDYTRGYRFVTYASLAIAKDFARLVPAETNRPDKAPTISLEGVEQNLRTAPAADNASIEHAKNSLEHIITDNLDQREQYIIINHFGLTSSPVKKHRKTLQQIGDHLGLTKERVRQIELLALQKLRTSLSIEEFDSLTK